ncbi:hypothetical protein MT325_m132R [Paramecium bursaria chlorella virus MT325]|uniref:Uncharacterized protein m132R n=1 Tax=Paramecium bursaria Chlorella virus MT325 TaxID=346932 RepID=A7ITL2_PBCVM|nr:hypothetical protein MT325_m132R [Paramecium bursaria chlorella virus MT325]
MLCGTLCSKLVGLRVGAARSGILLALLGSMVLAAFTWPSSVCIRSCISLLSCIFSHTLPSRPTSVPRRQLCSFLRWWPSSSPLILLCVPRISKLFTSFCIPMFISSA